MVAPRDWRKDFARISRDHQVIAIVYPNKSELMSRADLKPLGEQLAALGAARTLFVQDAPEWSPDLYRDDIHPTTRGNEVLAQFIAAGLLP